MQPSNTDFAKNLVSHYSKDVFGSDVPVKAVVAGPIMAVGFTRRSRTNSDIGKDIALKIGISRESRTIWSNFGTIANINNVLRHEKFHFDNHFRALNNGLFRELDVENSQEGIFRHLETYLNQINGEDWSETTTPFKTATVGFIKGYLRQIKDENQRNQLTEQFRAKLGDAWDE